MKHSNKINKDLAVNDVWSNFNSSFIFEFGEE